MGTGNDTTNRTRRLEAEKKVESDRRNVRLVSLAKKAESLIGDDAWVLLVDTLMGNYDHEFPEDFPELSKLKYEYNVRKFEYLARLGEMIGDQSLRIALEIRREDLLDWIERHRQVLGNIGRMDISEVEKAYRMYMGEYLGFKGQNERRYIHFIERSDKRFVWRCDSPCHTLEACKQTGLDTNYICTEIYGMASFRIFFDLINSKLTFYRNVIRPYAPYCEEVIELVE